MVMFKRFLYGALFLSCSAVHANELACPSEQQIKQVYFMKAIHNTSDPDNWDFVSYTFVHADKAWTVWFGTFLDNVKSPVVALIKGQALFIESDILIKNPYPTSIPNKILCSYTPTGAPYWIAALTPN